MRIVILRVNGEKVRYVDVKDEIYAATMRIGKYKKWLLLAIPVLSLIKIGTALASTHWMISSYFGDLDNVHLTEHKGIDFPAPEGTRVLSVTNGTVTGIYDEGNVSFGKSVHVLDGEGREIIYGHLSKFECVVGQKIHLGQEIALSGNTGHSTGSHIHIQVNINGKAIDPTPVLITADEQIRRTLR